MFSHRRANNALIQIIQMVGKISSANSSALVGDMAWKANQNSHDQLMETLEEWDEAGCPESGVQAVKDAGKAFVQSWQHIYNTAPRKK